MEIDAKYSITTVLFSSIAHQNNMHMYLSKALKGFRPVLNDNYDIV